MAKFKVGDMVRVIRPQSNGYMKVGVIFGIEPWDDFDFAVGNEGAKLGDLSYLVDIEGIGKTWPNGTRVAFDSYDLAPLTPPHEEQWQAFKTQFLTPDPATVKLAEMMK